MKKIDEYDTMILFKGWDIILQSHLPNKLFELRVGLLELRTRETPGGAQEGVSGVRKRASGNKGGYLRWQLALPGAI